MKARLHLFTLSLFFVTLIYDLIVWGAVPALDDVGPASAESARRESPLASTYIALGAPLDAAIPFLQSFGRDRLTEAWSESFERIREDRTVAMDLIFDTTWNSQHRWIRAMYWAPPLLLLATLLLWLRRSKQVHMLTPRR